MPLKLEIETFLVESNSDAVNRCNETCIVDSNNLRRPLGSANFDGVSPHTWSDWSSVGERVPPTLLLPRVQGLMRNVFPPGVSSEGRNPFRTTPGPIVQARMPPAKLGRVEASMRAARVCVRVERCTIHYAKPSERTLAVLQRKVKRKGATAIPRLKNMCGSNIFLNQS